MSKTENTEEQLKIVLEHYKAKINHEGDDGCDAFFYRETTADDYEVFIACTDDKNINVNEDVYYYTESWYEKLADYIIEGSTIYMGYGEEDEYGFGEVIAELYEDC